MAAAIAAASNRAKTGAKIGPRSANKKEPGRHLFLRDDFSTKIPAFFRLDRQASAVQSSTIPLKPPQNMRLPSKGMFFGSIIAARRGAFITLAFTVSRCLRDL